MLALADTAEGKQATLIAGTGRNIDRVDQKVPHLALDAVDVRGDHPVFFVEFQIKDEDCNGLAFVGGSRLPAGTIQADIQELQWLTPLAAPGAVPALELGDASTSMPLVLHLVV